MAPSLARAGALAVFGASAVSAIFINGSIIAPCDNPLYCYGEILKSIELARPFADSKTYVDLPTIRPLEEVIRAWEALPKPLTNDSVLQEFLTTFYGPAGGELEEVPESELQVNATFLEGVDDTVVRDFVRQVIDIWPELTRRYAPSEDCDGCVDSFLPLERTFVVAGGRFREAYYWDSFWIVEGLLRTGGSFVQIARNIIENFLDFVEQFGFVPNGSRIYYLNRSQPPLLTQMVSVYVKYTGDTQILERALPLLEKELEFWTVNRTVTFEFEGQHVTLNRYAVNNNQPRPESFREDFITATNESYFSESGEVFTRPVPSAEEQATLYSNLASGAESGWDYSSRWIANARDAVEDTFLPLRTLNTIETVPVDLNSILYFNEVTIADLYEQAGKKDSCNKWRNAACARKNAMNLVMWNETFFSYFDYNLTSNAQNTFILVDDDPIAAETDGVPEGYQLAFNVAQYYPYWTGVASDILEDPSATLRAYARVEELLTRRAGSIPATNLVTGEQWDQPNAWPPLQYILIKGLLNTHPQQDPHNAEYEATQDLALRLAQRYLDSTFCTWRATGGSTPELPKIEGATADGIIFEKYADNSTNFAGGGGEYEVVEGFGWTNGVLIWAADQFGHELKRPDCGNLTAADTDPNARRRAKRSAVEIHKRDAEFIKRFK